MSRAESYHRHEILRLEIISSRPYTGDMIGTNIRPPLKLAAIDLDGTLLGPNGQVSPANLQAVHRLQSAGVQVVLASGRHYRNMQRFAAQLPGVQWLVSCQGGELSNTERNLVLNREFLPETTARAALDLGRSLGLSAVAYSVDGIYTASRRNSGLQLYSDLSGNTPQEVPLDKVLDRPLFKIIWAGETAAEIDQASTRLNGLAAISQTVRTHQLLLELMPLGVSKASALKIMAARLKLAPAEIVAFGDGDNDVPMFAWAGVSVAMPHGWPLAIKHATYTAPAGTAETTFARGLDLLFDEKLLSN